MVDVAYAAFIGLVAGLIPVYLGLIPIPLLRRLSPRARNVLVSFSAGVLVFLFADVTGESVELAGTSATGAFLFALGIILGLGGPAAIFHRGREGGTPRSPAPEPAGGKDKRLLTAYMISIGIGLHNLGEGLALGAAYGAGQFALTTVLIVGFALHNGTEGLGIAGPVSGIPLSWREPVALGFIAGFPTILGSVIGAIAYTDILGVLFFAAAGGALLFVIVEMVRLAGSPRSMFAGIAAGILVMYFTDLLLTL